MEELCQRGGKGLISIKFFPFCPKCSSNPQPFVQADQGCLEILHTGIVCKVVIHKTSKTTAVISCQDWAHRESNQKPLKRIFPLKFKSIARANFFVQVWNDDFNDYDTCNTSSPLYSPEGFDAISKNPFIPEETETPVDKSPQEIYEGTLEVYAGSYTDDDNLFEETQPTTEPYTLN